jgi:hypothetical protein
MAGTGAGYLSAVTAEGTPADYRAAGVRSVALPRGAAPVRAGRPVAERRGARQAGLWSALSTALPLLLLMGGLLAQPVTDAAASRTLVGDPAASTSPATGFVFLVATLLVLGCAAAWSVPLRQRRSTRRAPRPAR